MKECRYVRKEIPRMPQRSEDGEQNLICTIKDLDSKIIPEKVVLISKGYYPLKVRNIFSI